MVTRHAHRIGVLDTLGVWGYRASGERIAFGLSGMQILPPTPKGPGPELPGRCRRAERQPASYRKDILTTAPRFHAGYLCPLRVSIKSLEHRTRQRPKPFGFIQLYGKYIGLEGLPLLNVEVYVYTINLPKEFLGSHLQLVSRPAVVQKVSLPARACYASHGVGQDQERGRKCRRLHTKTYKHKDPTLGNKA